MTFWQNRQFIVNYGPSLWNYGPTMGCLHDAAKFLTGPKALQCIINKVCDTIWLFHVQPLWFKLFYLSAHVYSNATRRGEWILGSHTFLVPSPLKTHNASHPRADLWCTGCVSLSPPLTMLPFITIHRHITSLATSNQFPPLKCALLNPKPIRSFKHPSPLHHIRKRVESFMCNHFLLTQPWLLSWWWFWELLGSSTTSRHAFPTHTDLATWCFSGLGFFFVCPAIVSCSHPMILHRTPSSRVVMMSSCFRSRTTTERYGIMNINQYVARERITVKETLCYAFQRDKSNDTSSLFT